MNIKKQDLVAHKVLVLGIVAILLVNFVVKKLLIIPLETKLSAAKGRVESLSKEKNNLEREVAVLKSKEAFLKEKESRLTEYFMLKSKLIDFNMVSKFLKDIVSYGGVKVDTLRPGKKEQVGQFKKWQLNISLTGSFTDINSYFSYLDSLPYLLNVKKVELSKGNTKGMVHANIVLEAVGR